VILVKEVLGTWGNLGVLAKVGVLFGVSMFLSKFEGEFGV
jgi:hypothetical protein